MELFSWSDSFLTHIPQIDTQHKRLVNLINALAERVMASDEIPEEDFTPIRDELLDYVVVHFHDEEALMYNAGLDHQYLNEHYAVHQGFVKEVRDLSDLHGTITSEQGKSLAEYLVHWLAFHILEQDQSLARQIRQMEQGVSAEEAYAQEQRKESSSTEPLLKAMNGLFYVVSQRNLELRKLNQDLELRVRERTRELEEANVKLERLSTHDDLSGLPNRRFAMLTLRQQWLEYMRYGQALSILMIDADHFKEVNDQFGHDQGDRVLVSLAERLRQSVRASDVVCRLGGDEFLVICLRCNAEGAEAIMQKILQSSTKLYTAQGEICWDGSVSIGIAEANPSILDEEALLKAADLAMYGYKQAQRKARS